MLPGLRFMLGAALAGLLLTVTVFGLAVTVRLAQQAKVSPLKSARTLAYASPGGSNEFDDHARQFEPAAGIVPLRRDESLVGAASSKPADQPEQHGESREPASEPVSSIAPEKERVDAVPPQADPVERIESITAAGEDRPAAAGSSGPDTEAAGRRSVIAANPAAEADGTADPAAHDEPLSSAPLVTVEPQPTAPPGSTAEAATVQPDGTGPISATPAVNSSEDANGPIRPNEIESAETGASPKRAQPHGARVQRPAPKSKTAVHAVKVKKAIAKRQASPANNPLAAGIGFPQLQNWSNAEGKIVAARSATKLTSPQLCGLGSALCSQPSLRAPGSRPTGFRVARTRPALSHTQ